jgi:L-arabinose transport system substrate-binding protein
VGIDSNLSDEKCLADIDSVFSMNADALLLVVTNQSMGPNIAERCREEGVELVTIDDNIVDEFGNPVPHVGMPTRESGELGGKALAELAVKRNFFAPGNVVKVFQIDVPTTTVIAPRIDGYREALMANSPLRAGDFIRVDTTEGMYEDNLEVAAPVILGNPNVTHWIITGANDDCALAPMTVLEEQGFNMDNVLACGLGGYEMSLEEFKNGNKNYICIVLGPDEEGYQAVKILYDKIVNGTEMPATTLVAGSIADSENYLTYFPNGKLMTDQ